MLVDIVNDTMSPVYERTGVLSIDVSCLLITGPWEEGASYSGDGFITLFFNCKGKYQGSV